MKTVKNKKIYEENDVLVGSFWQHKYREDEILKIVGFDLNENKAKIVVYEQDGFLVKNKFMSVHLFLLNYKNL